LIKDYTNIHQELSRVVMMERQLYSEVKLFQWRYTDFCQLRIKALKHQVGAILLGTRHVWNYHKDVFERPLNSSSKAYWTCSQLTWSE